MWTRPNVDRVYAGMKCVVLVALAACSSNSGGHSAGDGGTDDGNRGSDGGAAGMSIYANGSRLVWRVASTSDGLQAYYGIYDKQLATSCSLWSIATDGQQRCLPLETAYDSSYYADASCTTRVAFTYCNAAQPKYATGHDASSRTIVYPISGAHSGAVYVGSPGNCTAATNTSNMSFYTFGAALAPSMFVAVQKSMTATPAPEDLDQNGTRLHLQMITSTDGLRGPWSYFFDSQLGTECYLYDTSDGARRCLPTKTTLVSPFFGDASCTQPVLQTAAGSGPTWEYAFGRDNQSCTASSFYRIGGVHTGSTYYWSSTTCTAQSAEPNYAFYDVTPFALTGLETFTPASSGMMYAGYRSGTRIGLKASAGPDGARAFDGLHDKQLGIDCYFAIAADGQRRCIPARVADTGSLFSDASCTQPLATWNTCSPVPGVASSSSACGASYFEVGAQYTGPTYQRSGATCISATPTATTLYRLGAALLPSSFAAGTLNP